MSVLCELVVADFSEAEHVGTTLVPARSFDAVELIGLDTVKLAKLEGLATGVSYEDVKESYAHPAFVAPDDGPSVIALPDAFVARLAALDASERSGLAERWGAIEEFAHDGLGATDVAADLGIICAQATKAVESHRALFLRIAP